MKHPSLLLLIVSVLAINFGAPATGAEAVCSYELGTPGVALCVGAGRVVAVTAGGDHTCVLTDAGNVDCYGENRYGRSEAVRRGDVVAVDAGRETTCMLHADGNVTCQGRNDYGQAEPYAEGNAVGVSSGNQVTCVLLATGNADCRGSNYLGKAEDYTDGDAVAISAGFHHVCFLTATGNVTCQGSWEYGQSGNWHGGDALAVSAGGVHTCVLLRSGNVDCYGARWAGLDYPLGDATGVATGYAHTCVLLKGGNVTCAGSSSYGASRDYTGGDAVAVAAAGFQSCILLRSASVHCWGRNAAGEGADYVGVPSEAPKDPTRVPGVSDRTGQVTFTAPERILDNQTVTFKGSAYLFRMGVLGTRPGGMAPLSGTVEILLDGVPIAQTTVQWSWFWDPTSYEVQVPVDTTGGAHTLQAVIDRGTVFEGRSDLFITTVITDPPAAPRNLEVAYNAESGEEVRIRWDRPEEEPGRSVAGYKVIRTLAGDDQPLVTAWWRGPGTSFSDKYVEPNTTYTWHVWAWNEAGYSPEVMVTATTGSPS